MQKMYIESTTFFEEVIDNMETYEDNSTNTAARHGLSSANNSTEITITVTAAL